MSLDEMGCCGAYCGTCPVIKEQLCKGCKIGYLDGQRDIGKAKCKIKKCCIVKNFISCADCSDFDNCITIKEFYNKKGFKYIKYRQAIIYIKMNGYDSFFAKANNWKYAYGKIVVQQINQQKSRMTMNELNIALVQMRCEKGDIDNNLNMIEMYLKECKSKAINVVCFPEMNITGYLDPSKNPDKILSIHSDSVKQIMEWSKIYGMVIIVGFIEENISGKPFITQIAVKDGRIACLYRKKTVVDSEADWFSKGDALAGFTYMGVNIGLAICADIDDGSIFQEYKRLGMDLVFECAAPGLYGEQSTRNWQSGYNWWKDECYKKLGVYAGENQLCIAVSTQAGRTVDEDFPGGGYFFSANGNCINETSDWNEGILFGTLQF